MKMKIFIFIGTVLSILGINANSNIKCSGECTTCNFSCMPNLFLLILLIGKWLKKKLQEVHNE